MKAFQIGLLIFVWMNMLPQAYSQYSCGPTPTGSQNGPQGGGGGGNTTSSDGDRINIDIIISVDPNEIAGPTGYGPAQWVAAKDVLGYTILFENDPDFATAPAQVVRITQAIDPKMNPLSFRLGEFGFGSFSFAVPANASFYSERLDVRDSLGIYVDVTAGVDIINNQFFWIFESIDPATGLAPFDALKGFLPVNDTLRKNGEGFVSYTVVPVTAAITGDSILAQASIVFDINAPIETNTWKNQIDAGAPVSTMNPVPAVAPGNFIELSWSATDDPGGVGVGLYDLYVSKNGDPAFVHTSGIDTTHFLFTGEAAATYGFFVLSTDLVGNPEQPKDSVEQTTKLGNDSLLLLQPIAGSTYCYGSALEVQWFAKGLSGIDIEIYDAVLGDFVPIQSNVNPFFGGVSWIVPDGFSCNSCQVRISSTSDSTLSVLSLPFTILPAGVDTTNLQVFTCNPGDVGITTLVLTTEAGCDSLVITTTALETMPPAAQCRDICHSVGPVRCRDNSGRHREQRKHRRLRPGRFQPEPHLLRLHRYRRTAGNPHRDGQQRQHSHLHRNDNRGRQRRHLVPRCR